MNTRRQWATRALLVVTALVGGGWVLSSSGFLGHKRETLPADDPSDQHAAGEIAVTVASLQMRPIQRTVSCVGTLHAFEQVTLSSKVEGRVLKIRHDVGDRVRPGDLLLQIDPTDLKLSERQAQSALDVEMAKLGLTPATIASFDIAQTPSVIEASIKMDRMRERMNRVRTLVERGAMSRDELSNLTSDFQSLQAEHDNQVLLAKSGLATIQMKQESLAIARSAAQGYPNRGSAADHGSRRGPGGHLRRHQPHGGGRLAATSWNRRFQARHGSDAEAQSARARSIRLRGASRAEGESLDRGLRLHLRGNRHADQPGGRSLHPDV